MLNLNNQIEKIFIVNVAAAADGEIASRIDGDFLPESEHHLTDSAEIQEAMMGVVIQEQQLEEETRADGL